MNTEWEIPLFTMGDPKVCLFSFLCPCCAAAHARSRMDDSNLVFNVSCLCLPLTRWLIRTAYNINGDPMEDAATSICCFPCAVNQILHTTMARGNPNPTEAGMLQNYEKWEVPYTKMVGSFSTNVCYALICPPCAVGTAMENSLGTPFWFGCLFGMFPWTARNVLRYQYRIDGDDFVEDCAFPTSLCLMSLIAVQLCPYALICIVPYPVAVMGSQLLAEAEVRGPTIEPIYLAKSKPPKSEAANLISRDNEYGAALSTSPSESI